MRSGGHVRSPTAESNPGELQSGNADPRESARCRDTCPAAFHYFSTTGEDSRGLQGTGEDNELASNSLPVPNFTTKVAHRRRFSKTKDAGSIPAASTILRALRALWMAGHLELDSLLTKGNEARRMVPSVAHEASERTAD